MCHLDLAAGCPESWLNILSECVCKGPSGRDRHLDWQTEESRWVGLVHSRGDSDQTNRWRKGAFALCARAKTLIPATGLPVLGTADPTEQTPLAHGSAFEPHRSGPLAAHIV